MQYAYFPGCSLESVAREYDRATRAVMAALAVTLAEIPGWTCCGASAAIATDPLLALALPAVNLARAEALPEASDILVPCSACYLNLKRAERTAKTDAATCRAINAVLEVEALRYTGEARPRHLLDILSIDIGPAAIGERIEHRLTGLNVAPYYGCQCLRPYAEFDDPEMPRSMEPLIRATGAGVFPWGMSASCCGAAHMTTRPEVGRILVHGILNAAKGADAIVTVCPMCQMNLEGYQGGISAHFGENVRIPVLYLPQLLGSAMGISADRLGIGDNLAMTEGLRRQLNA